MSTRSVEVSLSMTANLGNFENVKVTVGLQEPFPLTRDRDGCVVELYDALEAVLFERVASLKDQAAAVKA